MRPSHKRSYTFLAVALLPLLLSLQHPQWAEPLHGFSLQLLRPVLLAGNSAVRFFTHSQELALRFRQTFQSQSPLAAKMARLESELLRLGEMERENERLKRLLDFRQALPQKTIAARIIGGDTSIWRKTMILDKGQQQGIRKDMAVVSPEGLVGRILEAGPQTSRVLLLTSPDSRASALTEQSRWQGMIAGNGSGLLNLIYLEPDSQVAVGERVISSEAGGLFPKGIRIGKVVGLDRDTDGLHLIARVAAFVKFSRLEEVLCLEFPKQK